MKNVLKRWSAGLWILAWAACSTAAEVQPIDVADDLHAVGRLASERGVPVMLVFTRPDCPYCTRAKKEHLEGLRVSPSYGSKVIMREIPFGPGSAALRDFDGTASTHSDVARRYEIRSVPTVMVVNAYGKPLAEPIVGLTTPDFYNLYLEQAIDAARIQLRGR